MLDPVVYGKVIWYIHGGGFTTGSAKERRGICLYLAKRFGYTCVSNNYRLSPEHKWPAHLDDCMEFYRALLGQGYHAGDMLFAGESAGGTLVLSVALRAKAEGLPMPAGIWSFSPCTEQSEGFPSHTKNVVTDYMLGDALNRPGQNEAVFGSKSMDKEYLKDPYISPYYGDYTGLPPIYLAASDTEVLFDDSVKLYEKLKQEGHMVGIDIAHELCHAYPMFPQIPEAERTIAKAVEFMNGKGE